MKIPIQVPCNARSGEGWFIGDKCYYHGGAKIPHDVLMEVMPSKKPVAVEIKGADGKTYYCSGGSLITPEAKARREQYREEARLEAAERSALRRQQTEERKKRSQLRDAAPDLLAALEALLAVSECADETGYVEDCGFVDLEKVQANARAAIAKAKGEAKP